jgi:hypothetical protein
MKRVSCRWLLVVCWPVAAWAGPLDERNAEAHLKAIASGDVESVMKAYGEDPWMDWVGGSLDGRYRGTEALRDLWAKFAANNEQQPRTLTHGPIVQNPNPKGVTLAVTAEYVGKTTVRVRHVLVYRDGKLATEVWQIDPSAPLN